MELLTQFHEFLNMRKKSLYYIHVFSKQLHIIVTVTFFNSSTKELNLIASTNNIFNKLKL